MNNQCPFTGKSKEEMRREWKWSYETMWTEKAIFKSFWSNLKHLKANKTYQLHINSYCSFFGLFFGLAVSWFNRFLVSSIFLEADTMPFFP
jgi:hypothetical protein